MRRVHAIVVLCALGGLALVIPARPGDRARLETAPRLVATAAGAPGPLPAAASNRPEPRHEVASPRKGGHSVAGRQATRPAVSPAHERSQSESRVTQAAVAAFRAALEAREAGVWRRAILELSRIGTPAAHRHLSLLVRDPRVPARSSDAMAALARHATPSTVEALQGLLESRSARLTKLRALQGLLLMLRWTERKDAGSETLSALDRARSVLQASGLRTSLDIEHTSRVPAFRHTARWIRKEIMKLSY